MGIFLNDRERAAEGVFAHEEELRFLAHRQAVEDLAAWAAECMALEAETARTYGIDLVAAFVSGQPDDQIVMRVSTDLERAGKPALSTTAGIVLAQAVALATDTLHGRIRVADDKRPPAEPRYHPIDPTLSWRG